MANANFFSPDGGITRYPLEDTEGRTTYEEEIHGVNLIQTIEQGVLSNVGLNQPSSARVRTKEYIKVKEGESYFLSGTSGVPDTTINFLCHYYEVDDYTSRSIHSTSWLTAGQAVTIPNGVKYVRILFKLNAEGDLTPTDVKKAQFQKGDKAINYRPYNQQSIQHQINAQTGVLGAKNLLEYNNASSQVKNTVVWTVNNDGSIKANGTPDGASYFSLAYHWEASNKRFLFKHKLKFSGCIGGSNSTYYLYLEFVDANNQSLGRYICANGEEIEIMPPSDFSYINCGISYTASASFNNRMFYPMIRLASDPSDEYVPYAMTNRELTEAAAITDITSDLFASVEAGITIDSERTVVYKQGKHIFGRICVTKSTDFVNSNANIGVLKSTYYPAHKQYLGGFLAIQNADSISNIAYAFISLTGLLLVNNYTGTTGCKGAVIPIDYVIS